MFDKDSYEIQFQKKRFLFGDLISFDVWPGNLQRVEEIVQ